MCTPLFKAFYCQSLESAVGEVGETFESTTWEAESSSILRCREWYHLLRYTNILTCTCTSSCVDPLALGRISCYPAQCSSIEPKYSVTLCFTSWWAAELGESKEAVVILHQLSHFCCALFTSTYNCLDAGRQCNLLSCMQQWTPKSLLGFALCCEFGASANDHQWLQQITNGFRYLQSVALFRARS